MIDKNERFMQALDTVILEKRDREGIGRLGEKLVHASLKLFYEPDRACHEVKHCGFVADILNASGVTEIQTGSFTPLKRKLEAFLPLTSVRVVHPVPDRKTVVWIDENGSFSEPRKSPKKRDTASVFRQLISILPYLDNPALTVEIVFLDVEEYRMLHPKYQKRRSVRYERVPTAYKGEFVLNAPKDYLMLLPVDLPASFTASEFSRLTKLRGMGASAALKVLLTLGALTREREGRGYRYYRALDPSMS